MLALHVEIYIIYIVYPRVAKVKPCRIYSGRTRIEEQA
jgi:hypothetical protein